MNFKSWLLQKENTNQDESIVSTAIDAATNYFGIPGPTELGIDLDNKQIGNFGKFVANQLDLMPLDDDTLKKYTNLCNSEPQSGLDFRKHKHNKIKACNILCKKTKSKSACKTAGCRKKQLRGGASTYNCPPTYDFYRDKNDNILGLS